MPEILETQKVTLAQPPTFDSFEDERQYRKERLAGALRIFGRLGFGEGVAGHITARDPERTDHLGQPICDEFPPNQRL